MIRRGELVGGFGDAVGGQIGVCSCREEALHRARQVDVPLVVVQLDDDELGGWIGALERGDCLGAARWGEYEVGGEHVVADVVDLDISEPFGEITARRSLEWQSGHDHRRVGRRHQRCCGRGVVSPSPPAPD